MVPKQTVNQGVSRKLIMVKAKHLYEERCPEGEQELTLSWVKSVLGAFSFNRRLLTWDSYGCHMMQSVKEALSRINVDRVIIPGGCTKYVQALDVSWNKPLKALVAEQYNEWMASGVQEYTEAGNVRPPSRKTIVEWN